MCLLLLALLLAASRLALAYPNSEKDQLYISTITAQAVQMHVSSDNQYLYLGFQDKVKIVDLGTFALAATQPYDFSADHDLDGDVGGIAFSTSRMYVSQDDGDILTFEMSNISAKPSTITAAASTSLGKLALNSAQSRLYIVDEKNENILVHPIGTTTFTTITLSPSSTRSKTFSVTDMLLVPSVSGGKDYIYVATDEGMMFYIIDGNDTATLVTTDTTYTHVLRDIAVSYVKDYIYVADETASALLVRTPETLAASATVEIIINTSGSTKTYNTDLTGVASMRVTNPSTYYTYVSGLKGVSVLNAAHALVNVGGSYQYSPIAIDGNRYGHLFAASDQYIYMSNEGGFISVITGNPWVTISGVTYSIDSSLVAGGSATLTFQSDVSGTYYVCAGGSVDQCGSLLVDTTGSSSGSVTAATDTTFTFNYNDNASKLPEGSNTVYVYVTDSTSDTGRRATAVLVDNPPPAVTVNSASFGNTRIYLNMSRLTEPDINHYNVYASNDPNAVINKTVAAHQIAQPSSGSEVRAQIGGLTNGLLYYASVEAVDNTGNVGPLTSTFPDGTRITATPELTMGPAELMGEKGCSVSGGGGSGLGLALVLTFAAFVLWRFRRGVVPWLVVFLLLLPALSFAEEHSPQWWTTEVKGGFWMPTASQMKTFFQPCCHLTGGFEQGFLYDSKFGVEAGLSIMSENGTAVGALSGAVSEDKFNLFLLPMETNFAFRADFRENQIIVPYVKFGFDYVFFRQNLEGSTVKGMKYGLHMVGGMQILLDWIDSSGESALADMGINDLYLTLEARYSWINNFGGGGLNLSGMLYSFGLLFEY